MAEGRATLRKRKILYFSVCLWFRKIIRTAQETEFFVFRVAKHCSCFTSQGEMCFPEKGRFERPSVWEKGTGMKKGTH